MVILNTFVVTLTAKNSDILRPKYSYKEIELASEVKKEFRFCFFTIYCHHLRDESTLIFILFYNKKCLTANFAFIKTKYIQIGKVCKHG